jgi:ubiquinone/menaquinone biosynthesis C-methylase UbiE
MSQERYIRALRFRSLTALYDPLVRWTVREALFKRRLLEQAGLRPAQRVLDLGCGTGTLAAMAKQRQPEAELAGLDADPEILERARRKASQGEVEVNFDQGLSTELPYEDGSFDRVLSTLFFHHLSGEEKRRTVAEIARVLKPEGSCM